MQTFQDKVQSIVTHSLSTLPRKTLDEELSDLYLQYQI